MSLVERLERTTQATEGVIVQLSPFDAGVGRCVWQRSVRPFALALVAALVGALLLATEADARRNAQPGEGGAEQAKGFPVAGPVIFVTDTMLRRAQDRVDAREEPFYSAWLKVKESADTALGRDYEPYNGGNHRKYFQVGSAQARTVRALALAFHVTGEREYSDKAREMLADWAADALASPDPAGDRLPPAGHPQGLVLGRVLAIFSDAYAMVWAEMSHDERAAVEKWFQAMVDPILESQAFWVAGENLDAGLTAPYLDQQYFNNHLGAQNMGLAAIGFATNDQKLIRYALNSPHNPRNLQTLIDGVIIMPADVGSGEPGDLWKFDPTVTNDAPLPQPGEIYDRYRMVSNKGFHYSHIHLRFISLTAEMAYNNRGRDYYDYAGPHGENFELSFDFYSEFLITGDDGSRTGYYEGSGVDYNMVPLYEVAARHYPQNEAIRDVLESVDRVQFDRETFGYSAVLTHGPNGIEPDASVE